MDSTPNKIQALKEKAVTAKLKYNKYLPAAFFVSGFIFDVLTLTRIDEWFTVLQQGIYLLLIIQILKFRSLETGGLWQPQEKFKKIWHYSEEALHFMLGTLLNADTVFYFKSSSLAVSFFFMLVIVALIFINELPQMRKLGLRLKFALFSICLFSYLFIVIPLALGFIGVFAFLLALIIGVILNFAFYKTLIKKNLDPELTQKNILYPAGTIATVLVILYFLKLLPPIPLSVQYMGIFHQIEKEKSIDAKDKGETRFALKYDRPAWKFWQNGDQDFNAEPGDKIICFVRIFAPAYFKEKIIFHWQKKYPSGWQTMDKIINDIYGGREEGFRSYASKSNYEPGDWRVKIETSDGQEMGRIGFTITEVPTKNLAREFKVKYF